MFSLFLSGDYTVRLRSDASIDNHLERSVPSLVSVFKSQKYPHVKHPETIYFGCQHFLFSCFYPTFSTPILSMSQIDTNVCLQPFVGMKNHCGTVWLKC